MCSVEKRALECNIMPCRGGKEQRNAARWALCLEQDIHITKVILGDHSLLRDELTHEPSRLEYDRN